jgi:hypothetical protein
MEGCERARGEDDDHTIDDCRSQPAGGLPEATEGIQRLGDVSRAPTYQEEPDHQTLKEQSDATIAQLEQELDDKVQFMETQRRSYIAHFSQRDKRLDQHISNLGKSVSIRDSLADNLEIQVEEYDRLIEQQKRNSGHGLRNLSSGRLRAQTRS